VIIKAFDLDDAWFKVVRACMESGYKRPVFHGTSKGQERKELDYVFIEITNPSHRPLVPMIPEGIPPPTSIDYVNRYLAYLMTPYKDEWESYTYGERMTAMSKIDMVEGQRVSSIDFNQLDRVIKILKVTPESNRSNIVIAKAEDLILDHPPCMRSIQFKVRYNKLHMSLYFRSWDAWGGFPSNLAALQLMKEYIGGLIEVEDGKIFAASMGLHVYEGEWEYASTLVGGIRD